MDWGASSSDSPAEELKADVEASNGNIDRNGDDLSSATNVDDDSGQSSSPQHGSTEMAVSMHTGNHDDVVDARQDLVQEDAGDPDARDEETDYHEDDAFAVLDGRKFSINKCNIIFQTMGFTSITLLSDKNSLR